MRSGYFIHTTMTVFVVLLVNITVVCIKPMTEDGDVYLCLIT